MPEVDTIEALIRRNRYTSEEMASLGGRPFSFEEWERERPPTTPEELADWEEYLRDRERERDISLAAEAGMQRS